MSDTRAISLAVAIDGMSILGVERLELLQCGHFSADRFRILIASNANPGGPVTFSALQAGIVTVQIGLNSGSLGGLGSGPLLTGQIDNVAVDFAAGQVVLSGRDLSARLIDAEVGESFSNQTASQIASGFAADAGLATNITATRTPVGQYYELAHTTTGLGLHTRHLTKWDLLASLAELEQFNLSVNGSTLNFGPAAPSPPILLTFGQDLIELTVDRALGLVAPKVTVSSWNPKLKRAFAGVAGRAGGVTLVRPNLTQAAVDRLAAARQAELAAQAVLLRASMPGELTIAPGSVVLLQGTGTPLDAAYVVRTIERSVDLHRGFIQRFEAHQVA